MDLTSGIITYQGFPRLFRQGGDLSPSIGGTSAGGQSINGGTHEGGIDLMEGLTLIDYIIN